MSTRVSTLQSALDQIAKTIEEIDSITIREQWTSASYEIRILYNCFKEYTYQFITIDYIMLEQGKIEPILDLVYMAIDGTLRTYKKGKEFDSDMEELLGN